MVLLVILGVLVLLGIYFISVYNKLVSLRNLVQEGWSSIDVMLKKRHDLIPNLVETVKGYATHERETLDSVIQARTAAQQANSVESKEVAEKNLDKAMFNLMAVAEQYPDLKANANFQQLQAELSAVEGDIEKARRYYNGTVRNNNTTVQSFPSNVVAGMFGFKDATFFELQNASEREVPSVKF